MKIDKKLIKELVENLNEFRLTELEYQEGDKKIKVSKWAPPSVEKVTTNVKSNTTKAVLNDDEDGTRIKSPIIGTAYSQCFFNCTNTSTHKLRFLLSSFASGSLLRGNSSQNETSFSFIRLGDEQ